MMADAEKHPLLRSIHRFFLTTLLIAQASTVLLNSLHAQNNSWKGIDSVWTNSANWDYGVPTASSKIIISTGSSIHYDPYVPAPNPDTATTGDLTVQSGAKLYFLQTPGVLLVHGTISVLNNSLISLGNGVMILQDKTTFNGGMFNADSGTITMAGSTWTFNGGSTFSPGTSTVILQGTSNQTITGDVTFYNLVVNTPDTVTISGAVTVQGNLTVGPGATVLVPSGDSLLVNGTITNNGTITGGGTRPLPVEMLSFSARETSRGVELSWSTATETDNYGFDVERSSSEPGSAGLVWMKVGFVRGAGTSNALRTYSFLDGYPSSGLSQYRIKQINTDGSFKYYRSIQIEVGSAPSQVEVLQNYPNPFNPSTEIKFSVANSGHAILKVHNVLGQEVAVLFEGDAQRGQYYRASFDGSRLASGVYFARLQSGGNVSVKRMVLMR